MSSSCLCCAFELTACTGGNEITPRDDIVYMADGGSTTVVPGARVVREERAWGKLKKMALARALWPCLVYFVELL